MNDGHPVSVVFALSCKFNAVYREVRISRSSSIDCGRISRQYGPPYGGSVEWKEGVLPGMLGIPIDRPDFDPGYQERITSSSIEIVSPEYIVAYPTVLAFENTGEKLVTDSTGIQNLARKRTLKASTCRFITASVLYRTTSTLPSPDFVIMLYHAFDEYRNVPSQWVPLFNEETMEQARLEYYHIQPNERAYPDGGQYWKWSKVASNGWLIARITDVSGEYNPLPSQAILPDSWFVNQSQWAFVKIEN